MASTLQSWRAMKLFLSLALVAALSGACYQYVGPSQERRECVSTCHEENDSCVIDATESKALRACDVTARACLASCPQ